MQFAIKHVHGILHKIVKIIFISKQVTGKLLKISNTLLIFRYLYAHQLHDLFQFFITVKIDGNTAFPVFLPG